MSAHPLRLDSIRALIVDIDGVLWQGRQALAGVAAFFDLLRRRNIAFVIASNNSARPSSDIVERLAQMNVRVDARQVLTSAEATAMYLPRIAPRGARVLLVGGKGAANALTRAGYALVDGNAQVVVVGLDPELTYEKLKRAAFEIRRGANFIGTNGDNTFPSDGGIAPGAGAILAALQAATDIAPTVIGKPERAMFDAAVEQMGAAREWTAVLGDRLDTDIAGARRAGLGAILVLTGITTRDMLAQSDLQPDLVVENLDALREAWEAAGHRAAQR